MTCHICKHTGERTCSLDEAEIRCMICGKCEAEAQEPQPEEGTPS